MKRAFFAALTAGPTGSKPGALVCSDDPDPKIANAVLVAAHGLIKNNYSAAAGGDGVGFVAARPDDGRGPVIVAITPKNVCMDLSGRTP